MPFESKAQRAYLFMHHPDVAKEFAEATPKGAKLPEHVKKNRHRRRLEAALRRRADQGNS